MSVLILYVNIHPLEHAQMRIASMQLLLQGLNDVRVQRSFRLADAAVVDLMLTIINTQLEMVSIDQDNRWTASSLPSAFRFLAPAVHLMQERTILTGYKCANDTLLRRALHHKAFVTND